MEATWDYDASSVRSAQQWAARCTARWGCSSPYLPSWLERGAELLGTEAVGRAVLAYDAEDRLLSLDVWCGSRRVFGMDDLL